MISSYIFTDRSAGYEEVALNETNIWDYLSAINEDGKKLENASARYEAE